MKYYFLALAVLVIVCCGCAGGPLVSGGWGDGQQSIDNRQQHVAPPASQLMRPGPMVDGPGPGVMAQFAPPPGAFGPGGPPPGFQPNLNGAGGGAANGGVDPHAMAAAQMGRTTQVRFVEPMGMKIGWKVGERYAENQLVAPARYNFLQAATFRLKLTNIPGREGLVLYPSLQIYPSHPTTEAYLSHNSIPIELTDEDLEQVESSNFVTKVIYLPDPKHQELAVAGVETLVSTRLMPGVDPVAEAERMGTIMLVLRMGNKDHEMPGLGFAAPQQGQPGQGQPPANGGQNGNGGINGQNGNGTSNGNPPTETPDPNNGNPDPFAPEPTTPNPGFDPFAPEPTETPDTMEGGIEQSGYFSRSRGTGTVQLAAFQQPANGQPPANGQMRNGTNDNGANGNGVTAPPSFAGQHVPPVPIARTGVGMQQIPGPMIVNTPGGIPWGQEITATPIGLPGPAHLPFGGPAGLRSHTMRNLNPARLPKPTDHLLFDVKQTPAPSLPAPAKHIIYEEHHPQFRPGELTYPRWTYPQGYQTPPYPGPIGPPSGR